MGGGGGGLNIRNERNIEEPVGVPTLFFVLLFISLKTKSNTQTKIPSINQADSRPIWKFLLFFFFALTKGMLFFLLSSTLVKR